MWQESATNKYSTCYWSQLSQFRSHKWTSSSLLSLIILVCSSMMTVLWLAGPRRIRIIVSKVEREVGLLSRLFLKIIIIRSRLSSWVLLHRITGLLRPICPAISTTWPSNSMAQSAAPPTYFYKNKPSTSHPSTAHTSTSPASYSITFKTATSLNRSTI